MNKDVPQAAEAVAESYVNRTPGQGANAQEHQRAQMGEAVRQAFAKTENTPTPEDALKPAAEWATTDGKDVGAEVGKHFVTEQNTRQDQEAANNGERTPAQAAGAVAEVYRDIAEKGFDNLEDDKLKERIVDDFVETVLDSRLVFRSLPVEDRREAARAMLQNPNFQTRLGEIVAGRLELSDADMESARQYTEAQNRVREAEAQLRDVDAELHAVTLVDKGNLEVEARSFDRADGKRITEDGSLTAEMDRLEDWMGNESVQARFEQAQEYAAQHDWTPEQINTLAEAARERIKNWDGPSEEEGFALNLAEHDIRGARLAALHEQQETLPQRIIEANDNLTRLTARKAELQRQLHDAQDSLRVAEQQQLAAEMKYVDSMSTALAEAGNGFLDEDSQKRLRAYSENLKKEADATADADTKKVLNGVKDRWVEEKAKGKETLYKLKDKVVGKDMRTMLGKGGPEAVLREIMLEGVRDPAERGRIEEKLKTDTEWVKQMRLEVASGIIARKMQTGKIYEAELGRIIDNKEWGPAALRQAIASDKERSQLIEDAMKQMGETNVATFMDRAQREAGGKVKVRFLWLLLLGAVGVAKASKLLASEGIRSTQAA